MNRRVTFILLLLAVAAPSCSRTDDGASRARPGEDVDLEIIGPDTGGEMVLVPGGEFTMGDPRGRPDERPHRVRVSAFLIDRYPVSQEMFETVTGVNPSKRKGLDLPVERTQWTEAVLFCNKCSEIEGLTPCYDPVTWECDFNADGYRLPTEAEWEHACRSGSESRYFFGDREDDLDKYGWVKPHSRGRTWPVGKKRPNRWGLYDMHGNVWQWCHDYYSESYYEQSPLDDPRGPATGKQRVLRGGAWNSTAEKCRAAYRFKEFPVFTDACFGSDSYGFRRARNALGASPTSDASVVASTADSDDSAKPAKVPNEPEPMDSGHFFEPPSAAVTEPTTEIAPNRLAGTIVFVSDRDGQLDIWSMRPNGDDLKQLTDDDFPDADPRFSPDGQQIMYTSLRDGFPEIWRMNRDGSGTERATEGSQAAWSPDGKSIVFVLDDQIVLRDLESGQQQRLTPDSWERCGVPAWRPDGQQVAVASRHLGEIGIFLLGFDATEPSQLATESPCCTPHWSHDGQRILFQTVQGHIHELDTTSGIEEQLTFGADVQHDGRYSPDGSMIVFCRAPTPQGPWQICITDLQSDDLDFVQITSEGSNSLPDWHE